MKLLLQTVLLGLLLTISINKSYAEEIVVIAKLDYKEVEKLLFNYVAKNPEYSELFQKYSEQEKVRTSQMDIITRAMQNNEMPFEELVKKQTEMDHKIDRDIHKSVELIINRELLKLINTIYPNKYKLILNESTFVDCIIYNELTINDITTNIKKYLLEN